MCESGLFSVFAVPLRMREQTNDEWALVVGRCFMEFGHIEQDVNVFWMRWNPDLASTNAYREKLLLRKINDIFAFTTYRKSEIGVTNLTNLTHNLNAVIEAANIRNLIAHNPLSIAAFEEDPLGDEGPLRDVFKSMRDGTKMLTYEELSAFLVDLHELRVVLGGNCMSAMGYAVSQQDLKLPNPPLRIEKLNLPATAFKISPRV